MELADASGSLLPELLQENIVKSFRCGDVVPGCTATFVGNEADILDRVGAHAREDHHLTEVSPELVTAVRAAMVPA